MRQRLTIILTIIVAIGLLVVINVVTYVKEENPRDSELAPNRSTYHAGPTGTRALYDFLSESGYKVMRWREAPEKLLGATGQKVQAYVVVGPTPISFSDDQSHEVLEWVMRGGHLILIERWPERLLLPQSGDWLLTPSGGSLPSADTDPSDPKDMTAKMLALQPVQPTLLTENVQSILPSRFASRLQVAAGNSDEGDRDTGNEDVSSPAPVVHFADDHGAVLVDYSYGKGRIVLLSDPYVVSNGGLSLKDNLQLAVNMVASSGGLIAFDEYHHGRGVTSNRFANYFAGTPVLAIGLQILVLILLILWTNSRRFARPLPLPQIDRRSTLEFVASMSELQERSRAYDLAIENIYSRTRRALARHAGLDYNSPRSLIASRVGLRSALDPRRLESLMRQCEEVINGSPVTWRQSIDLVRRIREVERVLGLRMRLRDERQATEKI